MKKNLFLLAKLWHVLCILSMHMFLFSALSAPTQQNIWHSKIARMAPKLNLKNMKNWAANPTKKAFNRRNIIKLLTTTGGAWLIYQLIKRYTANKIINNKIIKVNSWSDPRVMKAFRPHPQKKILFLSDIDETIVDSSPKIFVIKNDNSCNYYQTLNNFPQLIHTAPPKIIKNIVDSGNKIFALTTRSYYDTNKQTHTYADNLYKNLKNMGIEFTPSLQIAGDHYLINAALPKHENNKTIHNPGFFYGIIFCDRASKGDVLETLLKQMSIEQDKPINTLFDKIVFIDDLLKDKFLKGMQTTTNQLNIKADLFHFENTDPEVIFTIKEDEFKKIQDDISALNIDGEEERNKKFEELLFKKKTILSDTNNPHYIAAINFKKIIK